MNIIFNKRKRNFIVAILFLLLSISLLMLAIIPHSVKADEQPIKMQKFLPQSDLENQELSNVAVALVDNDLAAIVEDSYKFTLFNNGKTIINDDQSTLDKIFDVKLFNDSSLFFSANARLYQYNLISKTYEKLLLNGSAEQTVSYFDFNGQYLVSAYQNTCKVFSIPDFSCIVDRIDINDGSTVAINDNGQLFLVGASGIYMTSPSSPSYQSQENTISSDKPSKIIANNEFVYYISEQGKICRISISDGQKSVFETYQFDSNFQLGNISSPINISFKGQNLLVVQSDSIQEFKVEDDKLVFTGFAIAKNKTAYNRISADAKEIEKFDNCVAVLDNSKLMIYSNVNSENAYARENYKNYFVGEGKDLGQNLSSFALGKDSALLLYNAESNNCYLRLLDLTKESEYISDIEFPANLAIHDICYQNNYYYISAYDSNGDSTIYKYSQSLTEIIKIEDMQVKNLAVDVYQNIYLASDSKIIKLNKADNYQNQHNFALTANISKMQLDLKGTVYAIVNNELCLFDNGQKVDIAMENYPLSSFSLDFINDNVYFIKNGSEFIYSTNELSNISISDLIIPNEYAISNKDNFTSPKSLKSKTIGLEENAFIVKNIENKFVFDGLAKENDQYIYICPIKDKDNKVTLHALAGQENIALALIDNCTDVQVSTDVPEKAYASTSVNGYYLPIITKDYDYVMKNSNENIKLEKETMIEPIHKIDFLNQTYYYAKFMLGDIECFGYIPSTFTTEILEKNFAYDTYSIETVAKTQLFSDAELTNAIDNIVLEDGTSVRLLEKGKISSKIAVLIDGEWIEGYIKTSDINNEPNTAVRNILIIIALVACISGTSTYFILRKKN